MVDVVDEGYDLAVRIGHLSDSSLIAKRLSDAPLGLYASPTYLEQSGSPKSAHELSSHACIIDLNAQTPNLWRLTRGDEIEDVRVDGRLSLNGARAALSAASSGVGIAHSPAWAAGDWLDRGDLVKVLPEWQGAHRDLWAVFPSNRFLAHRVRIFVDHLSAWFKNGL
jgi:DNA-binding transcriptional LysR family regulator